ncbi:unnamed protein product [Vicia faba]|uniref:Uncharacterized protein n=1 Tax=Vicia faba TaxID=3906 RepID=A0AAV0ZNC1_VICFA|nr:unnamed protein product [Vicia faba]
MDWMNFILMDLIATPSYLGVFTSVPYNLLHHMRATPSVNFFQPHSTPCSRPSLLSAQTTTQTHNNPRPTILLAAIMSTTETTTQQSSEVLAVTTSYFETWVITFIIIFIISLISSLS